MTDNPDRGIVEQVQKGDPDAFAGLIDKYNVRIYNLAYRLSGSHADADDLCQVVFFKAFKSLERCDPGRPFFPWLYAIALNTIRNHCKRRRLLAFFRSDLPASPTAPSPSTPETELLEQERNRLVALAMNKLPYRQREALVLRYFEGCTFPKIAELQHVSLSAAKMRVRRGMARLAKVLKHL